MPNYLYFICDNNSYWGTIQIGSATAITTKSSQSQADKFALGKLTSRNTVLPIKGVPYYLVSQSTKKYLQWQDDSRYITISDYSFSGSWDKDVPDNKKTYSTFYFTSLNNNDKFRLQTNKGNWLKRVSEPGNDFIEAQVPEDQWGVFSYPT